MNPPLSEIDTYDLLGELDKRFKHVLVVMDAPHGKPKITKRHHSGDLMAAIGMAAWVLHEMRSLSTEPTKEDLGEYL